MCKYLLLTISLILFLGCAENRISPNKCNSDVASNSYAIYSTVLDRVVAERKVRGDLIIYDHSSTPDPASSADRELWQRAESEIPSAESALRNNFSEQNKQSHPLSRNFKVKANYSLISQEEINKWLDRHKSDWGFNSSFPNSSGVVYLSGVGFGDEMTKAAVYLLLGTCGSGCGEGVFFLLNRVGCEWIIDREQGVFIS